MRYSTAFVFRIPNPTCRLCSEPMCWTTDTHRNVWYHCHDCDMRDCDEETYEY
jgi:hypothetical protein